MPLPVHAPPVLCCSWSFPLIDTMKSPEVTMSDHRPGSCTGLLKSEEGFLSSLPSPFTYDLDHQTHIRYCPATSQCQMLLL